MREVIPAASLVRGAALVLLAGSLPLVSYDAAEADPPTCRGTAATIVGTPGQPLNGTDGPDVIVTDGATWIYAMAGDDTICVTHARHTEIIAGTGSDTVDSTAVAGRVGAYLGDPYGGEVPVPSSDVDTYVGGSGRDALELPADETVDIRTGGGPDEVEDNLPGITGTIDLGPGDDSISTATSPTAPAIDGGTGTNTLALVEPCCDSPADVSYFLDNRQPDGYASADGTIVLRWSGFTDFDPRLHATNMTFHGGHRSEDLIIHPIRGDYIAVMGGGDDRVTLGSSPHGIHVEGGPGTDTVTAVSGSAGNQQVRLDLSLRRGSLGFRDDYPATGLGDFENANIVDNRGGGNVVPVIVAGTAGANRISVLGGACTVHVNGRGGDDILSAAGRQKCSHPTHRVLLGGKGNDVITGAIGPDLIKGGPGFDRADGGAGADRCYAERTIKCEN